MSAIQRLLEKLKARNERDDCGGLLPQTIARPDRLRSIATLDPHQKMAPSPMLQERFEYAGEWRNAATGGRWLSMADMEKLPKTKRVQKQIALRIKNGTSGAICGQPPHRLSLYGLDEVEYEETYLLWGNKVEPQIVVFAGWDEKRFENLSVYLKYLIGGN